MISPQNWFTSSVVGQAAEAVAEGAAPEVSEEGPAVVGQEVGGQELAGLAPTAAAREQPPAGRVLVELAAPAALAP